MRATVLTLATAALLWGCGGDDASTSASTTTPTTSTTAGAPPDQRPPDKTPSTAEAKEALAGYRACLERHGVTPGSLSVPSGKSNPLDSIDEDLQEKLEKLRRAAATCRGQLPEDVQPGAASKPDLDKLRGDAEATVRQVQAFRACMGRHGYGPEADGTKPTGDLTQAFSDCRGEGSAGQ
jgi:hypothetical protein